MTAILNPKNELTSKKDARSTKGDEIRNEKVIPIGSPAEVNPINSGILEHEQNGVIVPKSAPIIFPVTPLNLPKFFLYALEGRSSEYTNFNKQ